MRKRIYLIGIIFTLLVFHCRPGERQGMEARESSGNLFLKADLWSVAVDPFGSEYEYTEPLIRDGVATVEFTIAKKTEYDQWYPFVELICDLGEPFTGFSSLQITYQCESDLLVKLSQSDFGEEGNETYSHYQYRLPATSKWKTSRLDFSLFDQPGWTPDISKDIPLNTDNINAVYLVPDLDPAIGESATLKVRNLELY
jgi:hypothetical protein